MGGKGREGKKLRGEERKKVLMVVEVKGKGKFCARKRKKRKKERGRNWDLEKKRGVDVENGREERA